MVDPVPVQLPADVERWLFARAAARFGGDVAACAVDAFYQVMWYDEEQVRGEAGGQEPAAWAPLRQELDRRDK